MSGPAKTLTLSVTEWVLGAPSTTEAIEMVARAGYTAIELAANPEHDVRAVRNCLQANGLTVSSLCGMYDLERDCSHESLRLRRRAVDYLRASLELAGELGAGSLVVVPTYRVEEDDEVDHEAELDRAAATIGEAAGGLLGDGPVIVLEALNRYETHLVRTLAHADELRRRIDSPYVHLMADVFHMNIEEDSITESLLRYAQEIRHIHIADSHRHEPGSGHIDFSSILKTVDEIGYHGPLAMEFVPANQETLVAGRHALEELTSAD